MKENKIFLTGVVLFVLLLVGMGMAQKGSPSAEAPEVKLDALLSIDYFWSSTCPYCKRQNEFWKDFELKYPRVQVNKYLVSERENIPLLEALAEKHNLGQKAGIVPMTFVGDSYFIGFDGAEGTGRQIEEAVQAELAKEEASLAQ